MQPARARTQTYHARVCGSLLGLEVDNVLLAARGAGSVLDSRQLDATRVSKQLKEKQASDDVNARLCSVLRGLLAARSREVGLQRVLILCLENEARRTLVTTVHADNVLPAHGAEVGEAVQLQEAGARK